MPVQEISVHEASEALKSSAPPRLIDVREDDEWQVCRLPGAELIPLSNFAELAADKLQSRDEALILYCHHGARSARAADYLERLGYTNVRNLTGGIDAWALEIDPSVPRY